MSDSQDSECEAEISLEVTEDDLGGLLVLPPYHPSSPSPRPPGILRSGDPTLSHPPPAITSMAEFPPLPRPVRHRVAYQYVPSPFLESYQSIPDPVSPPYEPERQPRYDPWGVDVEWYLDSRAEQGILLSARDIVHRAGYSNMREADLLHALGQFYDLALSRGDWGWVKSVRVEARISLSQATIDAWFPGAPEGTTPVSRRSRSSRKRARRASGRHTDAASGSVTPVTPEPYVPPPSQGPSPRSGTYLSLYHPPSLMSLEVRPPPRMGFPSRVVSPPVLSRQSSTQSAPLPSSNCPLPSRSRSPSPFATPLQLRPGWQPRDPNFVPVPYVPPPPRGERLTFLPLSGKR